MWKKVTSTAIFRLVVIIVAVLVPLNLLTLILANTVISEVERQISMETENALKLYISQVDSAMERMSTKLYAISREDEDFARLNMKEIRDQEEYYRQMEAVVRLNITMDEVLADNELINGVYAYFPEKDYFIAQMSNGLESKAVKAEVDGWLLQEGSADGHIWRHAEAGGSQMLLLLSHYRSAYFGAWIDLQELARNVGIYEESDSVFQALTGPEGEVYVASRSEASGQMDLTESVQRVEGVSYALMKAESRCAQLCYVQVLSKNQMSASLPAAIRVMQLLSVVAVAIIPIILFAMQYWIGRPVHKLITAMRRIEKGDVDYRIEQTREGTEFDLINRSFNRVMDEMSELKIHMYEQQLKAEKIRLGFLAQQIQPHFIINTLNILYSYEPEEYPLIQKMILCLSKYFRYVVNASRNYVELGREMEHIRNYFEIQQARFLHSFHATVVYDEEVADCLIPPLIIQNFTENAVKHSFIPGQITSIVAEARREGERIHVCVYDTGAGIPEEVLERIEEFRRTREFRMDLGVGIQNSIDRLNILYGDSATLDISRINPQGTRIDIMLPILRKGDSDSERDLG